MYKKSLTIQGPTFRLVKGSRDGSEERSVCVLGGRWPLAIL